MVRSAGERAKGVKMAILGSVIALGIGLLLLLAAYLWKKYYIQAQEFSSRMASQALRWPNSENDFGRKFAHWWGVLFLGVAGALVSLGGLAGIIANLVK
jgi:hypothetical protein